jgi:hypothetical protein
MAAPRKLDRAKHAALGRVARMKRKSPVDTFDMELFFGRPVRRKAVINHLRRTHTYKEESTDEEEPTSEEDFTDGEEEEPTYWVEPTIQEALPFKPRKMSVGGDLNLPHEILEAVLSHLPTLSLIVATGVNMTFRTIVQNSQTLQRNLFLRPTNKPREFVKLNQATGLLLQPRKSMMMGSRTTVARLPTRKATATTMTMTITVSSSTYRLELGRSLYTKLLLFVHSLSQNPTMRKASFTKDPG